MRIGYSIAIAIALASGRRASGPGEQQCPKSKRQRRHSICARCNAPDWMGRVGRRRVMKFQLAFSEWIRNSRQERPIGSLQRQQQPGAEISNQQRRLTSSAATIHNPAPSTNAALFRVQY